MALTSLLTRHGRFKRAAVSAGSNVSLACDQQAELLSQRSVSRDLSPALRSGSPVVVAPNGRHHAAASPATAAPQASRRLRRTMAGSDAPASAPSRLRQPDAAAEAAAAAADTAVADAAEPAGNAVAGATANAAAGPTSNAAASGGNGSSSLDETTTSSSDTGAGGAESPSSSSDGNGSSIAAAPSDSPPVEAPPWPPMPAVADSQDQRQLGKREFGDRGAEAVATLTGGTSRNMSSDEHV